MNNVSHHTSNYESRPVLCNTFTLFKKEGFQFHEIDPAKLVLQA